VESGFDRDVVSTVRPRGLLRAHALLLRLLAVAKEKVGEDDIAICSRGEDDDDEDGNVGLGVKRGEDAVPRPEGEVRFVPSWRCTALLWSPGPRMGFDAQYLCAKHTSQRSNNQQIKRNTDECMQETGYGVYPTFHFLLLHFFLSSWE
jgi:hypothetical protein